MAFCFDRILTKQKGRRLILFRQICRNKEARANLVESGERFGKGSPNSDEPIERIRTDETLADMAGVNGSGD